MLTHYTGGRTLAQARKEKAQALRDLEAAAKKKLRAEIAKLVGSAREKREQRRTLIRSINLTCEAQKVRVRATYDQQIAHLTGEAKDLRQALKSRGESERNIKAIDKSKAPRSTAAERAQESSEAVENDVRALSPALLPVWRAVQSQIKAGPGLSRFEAFTKWLHAHGYGEGTGGEIERMIAKYATKSDDAHACEEATALAQRGNDSAAAYAAENCEDGRPVKRRRKPVPVPVPVPLEQDELPLPGRQEKLDLRRKAPKAKITPETGQSAAHYEAQDRANALEQERLDQRRKAPRAPKASPVPKAPKAPKASRMERETRSDEPIPF